MKISIIYYSELGNTHQVAQWISEGALRENDTEVALFNLKDREDWDLSFLEESRAVLFGTPTYMGNMCWQIKKWFDTDRSVSLGGKLGGVFATENSPNGGGAELAMMSMINHMLVRGMLIYSSGAEFNHPFIHIGPAVIRDRMEEQSEHCRVFGQRMVMKAHTLFDPAQ